MAVRLPSLARQPRAAQACRYPTLRRADATLRFSRQTGFGSAAPDFVLPDTSGRRRTPAGFADARALLVAFICNHCPFVLHMIDGLVAMARKFEPRGVQVVAIPSNDTAGFSEDDYAHMAQFAGERALPFPYV